MKNINRAKFVLVAIIAVMSVLLMFALSACDENDLGASGLNYANASSYLVAERAELDVQSTATVTEIEVDWINGDICVEYIQNATAVEFYEVAEGEDVTADTTMHYLFDNSVLRIKYAKAGKFKNGKLNKKLYINLPVNFVLPELDIESVNGNIHVNCNAGKIDIENVNGNIDLNGTATRVDVESVNGNTVVNCPASDINVENVNGLIDVRSAASSVDVENVNGSITVACTQTLLSLDVETVSGNINLNVADGKGFRLEYETVTGTLSSTLSGQLAMQGRMYVYLGGGAAIDVETVSGSLTFAPLAA